MTVKRMLAADGSAANLLIRLVVGGVFFLEGIKKFLFPEQWRHSSVLSRLCAVF